MIAGSPRGDVARSFPSRATARWFLSRASARWFPSRERMAGSWLPGSTCAEHCTGPTQRRSTRRGARLQQRPGAPPHPWQSRPEPIGAAFPCLAEAPGDAPGCMRPRGRGTQQYSGRALPAHFKPSLTLPHGLASVAEASKTLWRARTTDAEARRSGGGRVCWDFRLRREAC